MDHETRVPVRSAMLMSRAPRLHAQFAYEPHHLVAVTQNNLKQVGHTEVGHDRRQQRPGIMDTRAWLRPRQIRAGMRSVMINWRPVPPLSHLRPGLRTNRSSPPCNYDFADPCISGTVRSADWLRSTGWRGDAEVVLGTFLDPGALRLYHSQSASSRRGCW